jgi:MFS transporter, DHA3 family, macrolide efflux protein
MAHPFLDLLRDRKIGALWTGLAFSGVGNELNRIAMVWLAIQIAGPNASFVSMAQFAVVLVVSLGASAFADRIAPRTLMIGADLLAALVALVPLAFASSVGLSLEILIATSMVLAALSALFHPALLSSVPLIAETRERIQGVNALLDATARLSRLLGPFLAGPLSAFVPVLHFLTINAASFLVSAGGIALAGKTIGTPARTHDASSIWERLTRGFIVARKGPEIRIVLAANTIVLAAWFVAVGLGLPFLAAGEDMAGLSLTGVGALAMLAGSYGAGDFVSNLLVAGARPKRPGRFMFTGYLILGGGLASVPVLLWTLPPLFALPAMILACFLAGLGGPMFFIPMLTLFQTELGRADLSSLIRFRSALAAGAMMLGSGVSPLLLQGMGAPLTILFAGALIALVGAWGGSLWPNLGAQADKNLLSV